MSKGVPKGYRHNWKYNGRWRETKTGPKKWKFCYTATKNKPSKSYGNHPKGRTIKWKINATQTARKTGKGRYETKMCGTKRLVHVGYKRPRK